MHLASGGAAISKVHSRNRPQVLAVCHRAVKPRHKFFGLHLVDTTQVSFVETHLSKHRPERILNRLPCAIVPRLALQGFGQVLHNRRVALHKRSKDFVTHYLLSRFGVARADVLDERLHLGAVERIVNTLIHLVEKRLITLCRLLLRKLICRVSAKFMDERTGVSPTKEFKFVGLAIPSAHNIFGLWVAEMAIVLPILALNILAVDDLDLHAPNEVAPNTSGNLRGLLLVLLTHSLCVIRFLFLEPRLIILVFCKATVSLNRGFHVFDRHINCLPLSQVAYKALNLGVVFADNIKNVCRNFLYNIAKSVMPNHIPIFQ